MSFHAYYEYVPFDSEQFFTVVLLPQKEGKFPTVVTRNPYVAHLENAAEDDIVEKCLSAHQTWLERGYAVVLQHCRGQGKSTGAFVPYTHEHEDSRALREWIRKQKFYSGELYLVGGSYTASLQYASAPFEDDIKGAVFEVQDSERYRLWYRNGQMRKGHANWHFGLYKAKCGLNKKFSMRSFSQLPLENLSSRVLGDYAEDFEEMLKAPRPSDEFWSTRNGGFDAKNATDNLPFPALFTTGYNDFYIGGMFKMWENMSDGTKQKCAMLVSPYDHGDGFSATHGISFPNGKRREQFGSEYHIYWLDHIRLGTPIPFNKGVITYYRMFENVWESDFYGRKTENVRFPLGEGAAQFIYDPQNPPTFCAEGFFVSNLEERDDVITVYTKPLHKDVFIKGQIAATLCVSTDRPDTSFYINLSIEKPNGCYKLRHDITSLCYQLGEYTENTQKTLDFTFDETAFLLKAGERLRIDVSSTDDSTYVCHTNNAGPYHLQTATSVATNTVFLEKSHLILPLETLW